MTKKIFRSIVAVAVFVFLASVILMMGVLYSYFSSLQKTQLKEQLDMAAAGIDRAGADYLSALEPDGYRITLIGSDGSVEFDSSTHADEMENHLKREEVREAIQTGRGESARYSITMMERQLYESVRLENGDILRISAPQQTLLGLLLGILQQLIVILGITLLFSFLLAYRLTKRIIRPLNELDITGDTDSEYEEVQPLIDRIKIQKNKIEIQQDRLKRRESEFEAVTRNMDEGLALIGPGRTVLFANPSAERILSLEHGADTTIESSPEYAKIKEIIRESEESGHIEKSITIGGKAYTLHADPVGSGKEASGTALLIMDMSWREKAEMVRREFTANVAHELKTPLQTISGSAELMYNGLVKDEDIRDFAGKIYSESRRLISLVEDITGLSQLDEGQYDHTAEDIDLLTESEHIADQLESAADRAGVTISVSGAHAVINGIKRLIDSIIYNLTDNAVKYSRPGGRADFTVSETGEQVILNVTDNGIGIPESERERVFERFYRVDKSRSKEVGGTGLGLSIVKHAAMVHDADVRIDSAAGSGTSVSVIFRKQNL